MVFWVRWEDGKRGSVTLPQNVKIWSSEAHDAVAIEWTDERLRNFFKTIRSDRREDGSRWDVAEYWTLPYPATPVIYQPPTVMPDGRVDWCPPFCWKPESCKGKGSCPRNPSCTS